MGLLEQRLRQQQAPNGQPNNIPAPQPVNQPYPQPTAQPNQAFQPTAQQVPPQVFPQATPVPPQPTMPQAVMPMVQPAQEEDDELDIFDAIGVKNNRTQPKQSEPPQPSEIPEVPEPSVEAEESEAETQLNEFLQEAQEEKKLRRAKRRKVIKYTVLVIACTYLLFLIYGVFVTNYQYAEDGTVKPVVLSVSEIGEKKNYDRLKGQYDTCRELYEKVLMLDYRLGQGVEDPLTLAPEYEALLDDVNTITIKTDALDVDIKYETIKNMLLTWIKTDCAVYLQKISSGIAKNNEEDAVIAVQYKAIMYDDFSIITQNLIKIGENTKGAEVWDMKKWSPEGYVNETVGK